METWLQDIRYGLRLLVRKPALTIAAVLSLSLGIGANVTVFNWVKTFLFRPFPGVERPDDLVLLGERSPAGSVMSVSYPNYSDLRDSARSFSGLLAFRDAQVVLGDARTSVQPEKLFGATVSGNYFDVLGVRALFGRTFLPEEDRTPDTHPVTVISHALWTRRFGANPAVVGTQVPLNGRQFTIIGITPPNFFGTFVGVSADLWVPMMMEQAVQPGGSRLNSRGNHWLQAVGRLQSGVSKQQAQAEIDTLMKQIATPPDELDGHTMRLYTAWDFPGGASSVMKPVLLVLWVVVGLVLLIACANLANLLLVRALGRRREVVMRLSLGASRWRLLRQLLTESMVLAAVAGSIGLAITPWTTGLLVALVPPTGLPIHLDGTIDRPAVLFSIAVTVATSLLFGLTPALHATSASLMGVLRDEASNTIGGRSWLKSAMVTAQVALSVLLLICAGLFLQSLRKAQTLDTGFGTDRLLLASYDVFPLGYTPQTGSAFHRSLLERVRSLPGVEAASVSRRVPLGLSGTSSMNVTVEGYEPAKDEELNILLNWVETDYFRTIGLPILRGREFTDRDTADAPKAIIVNETMARRYWPNRDAIGGRVKIGPDFREVVGVAKDAKYTTLSESPRPYFYLPVQQAYVSNVILQVRSSGAPESIVDGVRGAFREADPRLPLTDVKTISEQLQVAVLPQRIAATLLSIFGSVALFLSTLGLYSVLAYTVSQRTREVGIRMALGAGRSQVLHLVVSQGVRLSLVGLLAGLALAFGLTRFLSGQLNGVSPTDLFVFSAVPILLFSVAIVAMIVPTLRAVKIDPMEALRHS